MNILTQSNEREIPKNLIREIFSDEMIRTLFYHCLRVDIPDNNDKAEMIKMLLDPNEFDELGTGTNRIAFLHNGLVCKIALDRRGMVDNLTEFKRSSELPMYLAKCYETNMVINLCEYVSVLDQSQFIVNEEAIKEILKDISKSYLFDDVGYTLKNSYNWGFRESKEYPGEFELVILDYGYLYPLIGQNVKELYRCPKCNASLTWDINFTKFKCRGNGCNYQIDPTSIRQRMKLDFEDLENSMISELNHVKMPNLKDIEKSIHNQV